MVRVIDKKLIFASVIPCAALQDGGREVKIIENKNK